MTTVPQNVTVAITLAICVILQYFCIKALFKHGHRPLSKFTDALGSVFDAFLLDPLIVVYRLIANLGFGRGVYLDLLGSKAEQYRRGGSFRESLHYGELAYKEWQRYGSPADAWSLSTLHGLAGFYLTSDRFSDAEMVLTNAVEAFRRAPNRRVLSTYGELLSGLGYTILRRDDVATAKELCEEGFRILNKELGLERMETLEALAYTQQCCVRSGESGRLDEDQLDYLAASFQNEFVVRRYFHLATWRLHEIAATKFDRGDYRGARKYWLELVLLTRRIRGMQSMGLAPDFFNLALCAALMGRPRCSAMWLRKAVALEEGHIRAVFSVSDELQRLSFVARLSKPVGLFVALIQQWPEYFDAEARKAAFLLATRRKGLVAEAMLWQGCVNLEELSGEQRALLHELHEVQKQLIGPTGQVTDQLRQQENRLSMILEGQFPQLKLEERLRKVDDVSIHQALSPDTVLLEIVKVPWLVRRELPRTIATNGTGSSRYCGFYARRNGVELAVAISDFGEAKEVDGLVSAWLAINAQEGEERVLRTSPAVEGMWKKFGTDILRECAGATKLVIAPDGHLAGVPFEALRPSAASADSYLINSLSISYLTAGRDLLRSNLSSQTAPDGTGRPLFVGVSKFGVPDGVCGPGLGGGCTHSSGGGHTGRFVPSPDRFQRCSVVFGDIPGARAEIEGISRICDARVLLDEAATEGSLFAALQRRDLADSPVVLHFATHGWGLTGADLDADNPMKCVGLALFGAQNHLEGRLIGLDDAIGVGLLTGLDVLKFNLRGTELGVLSGCRTGVGHLVTGEGVLGLQRSFVLAGASTVVMSVWNVPDGDTAILMRRFYAYLGKGVGKADALRRAKLSLLKIGGRWAAPRSWAGFVLLGNDAALTERAIGFFK